MRGLLLPPTMRDARRRERRRQVLRFLREEIWSNTDILGKVMDIGTVQGALKALHALSQEEVISSSPVKLLGRTKFNLWGITPHGLAQAFDLDEPYENRPYFEPSRVSLAQLEHHLDIQRLRLKAETAGWKNWKLGTALGKLSKSEKRPDVVATSPKAETVAIEVERTIKTLKRYEEIMSAYLQRVKQGDYHYVAYLCPTDDLAARLKRLIYSIKTISVRGQRIKLEERHYQAFRFYGYDNWPDNQGKPIGLNFKPVKEVNSHGIT